MIDAPASRPHRLPPPATRAPWRGAAAALPGLALLAAAPGLVALAAGWTLALAAAAFVAWTAGDRRRAVRQAALHAITIPLLPALAIASGVDASALALDPSGALILVALGAATVAFVERRRPGAGRTRRRVAHTGGEGIVVAAAAVVAVRAALAAGPAWTPRLAAGVLAFGVLRWGWRAAASVDRLRRRRSSRRRAERVWRAIDRHGIEVPTLAVGRLVAEWGAAAGRLLPVSLAGEARIVFGGLVLVLAYLLWTR